MRYLESTDRRSRNPEPLLPVRLLCCLLGSILSLAGGGCSDSEETASRAARQEGTAVRSSPHRTAPGLLEGQVERHGQRLLPDWAGGPGAAFTTVGRPRRDPNVPHAIGLFGPDGSIEAPAGSTNTTIWLSRLDTGTLHASQSGTTVLSLAQDYCPIPKSRWPAGEGLHVETELTALAADSDHEGPGRAPTFCYRIGIFNVSGQDVPVRLFLVKRPYGLDGTITPLAEGIEVSQPVLCRDRTSALISVPPHGTAEIPPPAKGHPSAATCWFDLDLPSSTGEFSHVTPAAELFFLFSAGPGKPDQAGVMKRYARTHIAWEGDDCLNKVRLNLPDKGLADTFRAATAQILIAAERTGMRKTVISPEPFNCIETATAAAALNRAGQFEAARLLLGSFSQTIGRDGRIADQIDAEGNRSPPANHEPNGRALFCLMDHFLFTGDLEWLETRAYPIMEPAADHLIRLLEGEKESSLLPAGRPGAARRYADSFWAIEGLESASRAANLLGKEDKAALYETAGHKLEETLRRSLRDTMERKRISFIPGSPDTGSDGGLLPMDALSNGACAWPGNLWPHSFSGAGRAFELYYERWFLDPEGGMNVNGSILSAGMEVGLPLLALRMYKYPRIVIEWYGRHFTSAGFHTWGEIISRDAGLPDSSGAPSLRAAADYVLLLRNMLVLEEGDYLFLAPGVTIDWFKAQEKIGIRNAPTRFGPVSYQIHNQEIKHTHAVTGEKYSRSVTTIDMLNTTAKVPKGYLMRQVYFTDTLKIKVNGKPYRNVTDRYVMLLPADARTVEIEW